MNILQLTVSVDPSFGGPVEVVRTMSLELVKRGHSVRVVTLDDATSRHVANFPVPTIGLGPSVGKYAYSTKLSGWVRDNANRFDVAVLHGLWDYSSFGAWRGLRQAACPFVIFTHGMLDPYFRRGRFAKHLVKQVYWLVAIGRVLRSARYVLFTCEEEKLLARQAFRGYSYIPEIVPLGTDDIATGLTPAALPSRAGPSSGHEDYIVFLGRIHPKKGVDILIDAFRNIHDRYPDVALVIAGSGDPSYVQSLVERAVAYGIGDRVSWPGLVTGVQKARILSGACAFVLPSHQENFGVAVVEALACAVPVLLSTKVNIWREVVSGGGGIAADDTVSATTSMLEAFLSKGRGDRDEMRRSARRTFEEKYNISTATARFEAVLRAAIGVGVRR